MKKPIFSFPIFSKVTVLVALIILNYFLWFAVITESGRDDLTVYFLDVGQGDATLIETKKGNRVLIDAGDRGQALEELSKIIPFYDRRIDVFIATHPHSDHIGGFSSIVENFKVGAVLDSGSDYNTSVSGEYLSVIDDKDIPFFYAREGMVINLRDGAFLAILFPDRNTKGLHPDNASVWSHLLYGETTFLFTGDSHTQIESYVAKKYRDRLESNVFQAGHHGSRTSNSIELLEAVSPDVVVVSSGEDNSYGHPHIESMENFASIGAEVFRTSELGNVVFISDGEEVRFSY